MERWKSIETYDDYQVSDHGKVRNIKTNTILKNISCKRGYQYVNLFKDGKRKKLAVHRLVGEAFVNNEMCKPIINHLNEIKYDNHYTNLSWATYTENNTYGNRIKKMVETKKKPITQYTKDMIKLQDFDCVIQAAESIGVNSSVIRKALSGDLKTAYGYKWYYKK